MLYKFITNLFCSSRTELTMFSEGQAVMIRDCNLSGVQIHDYIDRRLDSKVKSEHSEELIRVNDNDCSILPEDTILSGVEELPTTHLQNKTNMESLSFKLASKAKADGSENKCINVVVREKKKKILDKKIRATITTKKFGTVALCSKCGKHFSTNYNLKRHMVSCKLCPEDEKGPRYHCQCGRTYSQEWDMKKHKLSCQDNTKHCKTCLFPFCNLLFYHRSQLLAHMKAMHNVNVQDPEIVDFASFDEFKVWKEGIEEETYTYYSKQTGSNVTGVSVNTYYVCQHDGSDRTHSSLPRKTQRRNKKGRVKTGRFCWSQMNVKEFQDGNVRVTFYPSHTHPISAADTEHHPLPPSITSEIERRLTEIKQEAEAPLNAEYSELKKSRKKSYAVNVRTLRALARKNRKLFRITAEAIGGADEMKVAQDVEEEKNALPEAGSEEAQQINEPISQVTAEQMVQSCHTLWNQINTFLTCGKLSDNALSRAHMALSGIVENCREDLLKSEEQRTSVVSLSDLTEVIYQAPQASPSSPSVFPLEEPQSTLHIQHDEKTVYQVVTLGTKEEPLSPPPEELLYHNAVEFVGPREFIIIANDHSQIFHPVTTNPINLGGSPSSSQLWTTKR